jgi:hypothetical protein
MTIWKFTLKIQDRQEIRIPGGGVFLRAQWQHGELQVWAIVAPERPQERRAVWIVGTGHTVPSVPLTFIDTVQTPNGAFVWHVFVEAS